MEEEVGQVSEGASKYEQRSSVCKSCFYTHNRKNQPILKLNLREQILLLIIIITIAVIWQLEGAIVAVGDWKANQNLQDAIR